MYYTIKSAAAPADSPPFLVPFRPIRALQHKHVRAILAKLGAANRTEAVAIAMRNHLLRA